jgi:Zinc knuckle
MKLEFNLQARDNAEAIGATGAIKKENRSKLKLPELGKLEDRATTPLPDKFTLLSLGDKNEQLADAYNVTMRLVEMGEHFKRFDLQDVFYIVKTKLDPDGTTIQQDTSKEPLYLVDDYSKISIQEIRESIRFFRVYGQIYHIENLEWSELFLKGSCDDVLRKKVMEYLINVPDIEKGGPLFYKVMMMIIVSNTEEAIRTLTLKVSTFKITSIQGENISIAVSQLRGAYRRLILAEKVPHDIADRLISVFCNTSMDEFNATFKTMKYNIRIENRVYDPEDILRIAELTYTEMIENGSWNSPSTAHDSGFVVNTTCWNCGGKGHRADECPSKKATGSATPNKTRSKWAAPKNGESDLKLIHGKPYRYNKGTKRWDKQTDESATGIASTAAKVASESSSENQDVQPAACVASFSTVVQSGVQDAFYKFSH